MKNPSNKLIAWTIGPLGIAAAGVIVGLSVQASAGENPPQETVTTVVTSTAVVQPPAPVAETVAPETLPAQDVSTSDPVPVAPPTVNVVTDTPQQQDPAPVDPPASTPENYIPAQPQVTTDANGNPLPPVAPIGRPSYGPNAGPGLPTAS